MATSTDDAPVTLDERYRSAVHARSMKSDPRTFRSNTDVLAAMGMADRDLTRGFNSAGDPIRPAPLAVSLERLFAGDNKAVHAIVETLTEMAWHHSKRLNVKIGRPVAHDLACCVLAWVRSGTCVACGGHGYDIIPGAPMLSDHECKVCRGTGKMLLDESIDPGGRRPERREIARWLVVEIEREVGRAAPVAMALLADRMDL